MQIVPLTTQTRILQVGDSCTYSISGTNTGTSGAVDQISGTAVHSVIARDGDLVTLAHYLDFQVGGIPFKVHEVFVIKQNPDGSSIPVSDNLGANQTTRTVVSTDSVSPGTWSSPLALESTTTYSDGSSEQDSFHVTGSLQVDTAIARFASWVLADNSALSSGTTSTSTSYVVPELGFWVKRFEVTTTPSVGTARVTFTLLKTTVPLPG